MQDQQLFIIGLAVSAITLGVFIQSFRKNRTSLVNGFIFNLFALFFAISIIIGGTIYSNLILRILLILVLGVFVLIISSGITILILALLINARIVLKREKKSLANFLTLLLALNLIGYFAINLASREIAFSPLSYLMVYLGLMILYFGLSFYNFIIILFFNSLFRPSLNSDYIIVLGSGLLDGRRVSKLLGSRIDKALKFYKLQKEAGVSSKIIFSGGQGKDEKISEAEAMAKYATDRGVSISDIIIENKSQTTLENFKFSKQIMDRKSKNYQAIFSTSNYHVLRASIYAKMVGLPISGMASKTALYYLPNAMIREYIAILAMKKKSYAIKVASMTIIFIVLAFVYAYLEKFV